MATFSPHDHESTAPGAQPAPLDAIIRARMEKQRTRDTAAELLIRRALHASGYRYRLNVKVPGAPRRTIDIAFTRRKLAVLVDGCFWHGCPEHCVPPKHNDEWWAEKLARNRARDVETTALLEQAGWRVLRIWEHVPVDEAVARIARELALTPVRRSPGSPDAYPEAGPPPPAGTTP